MEIKSTNYGFCQKSFKKTLLKIIGVLFNLLIVVFVLVLLGLPNGEITLLGCRIVATFGMLLMGFSTYQMIKMFHKTRNKNFNGEKPLPFTMSFFISFMTMITFYGYFSRISKIIIFRNFDFVLHYENQVLELTINSIYIVFVCVFLVTQLLFFLIVAPVSGIGKFNLWLFCSTLFINALQKWLFKSTVVHMELCEKYNENGDLCSKYMHYKTSYANLTNEQKEHYYSIKEIEPLTYTITMELFIACIGLNIFFDQQSHHIETLPEIEAEVKPHLIFAEYFFVFAFATSFISSLFIIIAAPIISVYPELVTLSESRTVIRCITHLANSWVLWYMIHLMKIPYKLKWSSEADIIILWIAGIINAIKAFSKCVIHCTLLCKYYNFRQGALFGIAQIGNTFETVSFYFFILVIERLILIAEQPTTVNTKKYLTKFTLAFLPLYFCTSLIGFAAYYNLNGLHFFPDEVDYAIGVNLIVFLQSTYPTTMLFTTTACLCIASIMEKLYQKGYYRLKKNFQNDTSDEHEKCIKIVTHF